MGNATSAELADPKIVFFDLEATGLQAAEILQIGAVDLSGGKTFNQYVYPDEGAISPYATKVNGLTIKDRCLYKQHLVEKDGQRMALSQKVYTKKPEVALGGFISWLRDTVGGPVVLVAYNGLNFDAKVLAKHMRNYDVECSDVIKGFSDPYLMSKELFPDLEGRKQSDLLEEFKIKDAKPAHDAIGDAENLRRLTRVMVEITEMKAGRGRLVGETSYEVACARHLVAENKGWFISTGQALEKYGLAY